MKTINHGSIFGRLGLAVSVFAIQTACQPVGAAKRDTPSVAQHLETLTRTGRGLPGPALSAERRADLRRLYEGFGHAPLWISPSGDLRGTGKDVLTRLRDAASEGLRPEDYDVVLLDSLSRRLGAQKDPPAAEVARLDAALSRSVLRFLQHIHVGRVAPRSIGLSMAAPRERHDPVALLDAALRDGTLEEAVAELAPPLAQYGMVRAALSQLRKREADSAADVALRIRVPLEPGDTSAALGALARRLALTGDLPESHPAPARYDGVLIEAVRRFQLRHGIKADSVLGKETLEALNVPLSWRVHQLELALERLRWLGDLPNEPYLLVNIPMFEVSAWSSPQATGEPAFRTGVIVGKALDTETPVFIEEMRYIIFQPYWNIPISIARNEILPALEKDGRYLEKQAMEIVDGQSDNAEVVGSGHGAAERVARGELRIRQRPGPQNALGPVKFVFPNNQNIYLHGTPAEHLFDRSRRDFSHGCVRVEDPTGLAEWILAGTPEWDRAAIEDAMADRSRISRRVNLARPLPVVLFYSTASVEANGAVRFAKDIYQHDAKLDKAIHAAGQRE